MRKVLPVALLPLAAMALFGGLLAAQSTPGIAVTKVVHEPEGADVGPFILTQVLPNPDYDPLQPTGQPQFIPAWGNGRGLSNELDSISSELYALGGTTTHDLCVMTNTTGADLLIDTRVPPIGPGPGVVVTGMRPAIQLPSAPEQISPGHSQMFVIPYDQSQVAVPNGSTVAVWMLVTKWFSQLDTSPRDYFVTFQFNNIAPTPPGPNGPGPKVVDVPLTVPRKNNAKSGGCVASESGLPQGVALLAGGTMYALTRRRRIRVSA